MWVGDRKDQRLGIGFECKHDRVYQCRVREIAAAAAAAPQHRSTEAPQQ